jgi:hypothetical protein
MLVSPPPDPLMRVSEEPSGEVILALEQSKYASNKESDGHDERRCHGQPEGEGILLAPHSHRRLGDIRFASLDAPANDRCQKQTGCEHCEGEYPVFRHYDIAILEGSPILPKTRRLQAANITSELLSMESVCQIRDASNPPKTRGPYNKAANE